MAWYNTLNVPKLINEDGKLKFLPVIYAQQYEIEYRYFDELGREQNSGSITIDYDSRANDIGNETIFIYKNDIHPERNVYENFLKHYSDDFSVIDNNSRFYTAGFILLNLSEQSDLKPLNITSYNLNREIGIQKEVTYFTNDSHISNVHMSFNVFDIGDIFPAYKDSPPPPSNSLSYIRYCFNAVDLSTYMENIPYSSIRIRAKNGRFPHWYSQQNDSPWSNWFYMNYKPNEVLIETYINNNENNTLYKNNLEFKGVFTGAFRQNVSVTEPIIELELNEYPNFNYIYVREFNRFYFISNVVVSNKNLYLIYCSVDVLMSFRHDIDNLTVLLNRSTSKNSDFLIDDFALGESDYDITIHNGVKSNLFDYDNGYVTSTEGFKYINKLDTTIIFSTSSPSISHFMPKITANELPSYSPFSSTSNIIFGDKSDVNNLIVSLMTFTAEDWKKSYAGSIQNSTDLISSIRIYPFTFLDNPDVTFKDSVLKLLNILYDDKGNFMGTPIKLGNKDILFDSETLYSLGTKLTSDGYYKQSDFICTTYVGYIEPKNIIDNFTDKEPYTTYQIYIPFVGFQEIESKLLEYDKIDIYFHIDLSNGESMCVLKTNDLILKIFNTNISIEIPVTKIDEISRLTAVRRNDIENKRLAAQALFKGANSIVSGSINRGISISREVGEGEIFLSGLQGVTNALFTGLSAFTDITSNNKLAQLSADTLKASVGEISPSRYLSLKLGTTPYIIKSKQKISPTYSELIKKIGKPSNFYGEINSLTGFNKVDLAYPKMLTNITLIEYDMLIKLLQNGIFIGNRNF